MNIFARLCIICIRGLRPLLGPAVCKYAVGCTDYAVIQLQDKPLLPALWSITKRLLACNPIYSP